MLLSDGFIVLCDFVFLRLRGYFFLPQSHKVSKGTPRISINLMTLPKGNRQLIPYGESVWVWILFTITTGKQAGAVCILPLNCRINSLL
jgi:hypothetical protein